MRVSLLIGIAVLAAVVFAGSASAQTIAPEAPALASITVERFEAASACVAAEAGRLSTDGEFIEFAGVEAITSLSFSPGAVNLNGKSVEFHGHEKAFQKSSYTGTVRIPNQPGRTVSATMDGSIAGAADCNASTVINNLTLGDDFSRESVGLGEGDSDSQVTQIRDYRSSLVPELEGENIVIYSTRKVTGYDAANGILTMETTGSITVSARSFEGSYDGDDEGDTPEESDPFGLGKLLLLFGAIGTSTLLISRFRD